MTLNCWIVDDEPLALSLLESYVQRVPFLKLTGKYSNALSAMKHIVEEKVDLMFLDIQMPEVNGMEFARILNDHTRVVFTTAFSEYAVEGYKVNAIDYLLKPFSFSDFLSAAKKVLSWFEMTGGNKEREFVAPEKEKVGIFIKSEYKLLHVLYEEILYIEGLKDYVKIYIESDTKPILSLMSLKSLEELLPADRFLRVHRSYIIHRNKISSINKNRISIGKKQVPVGETYRKQFREIIEKG